MSHYPLGLIPAGVTHRGVASVIDLILLTSIVVGLDFALPNFAFTHYLDCLFFVLLLGYLSIFGSNVGNGQTLGKWLMGIQVVDTQGQLLSFSLALRRYLLLVVPAFLFFFDNAMVWKIPTFWANFGLSFLVGIAYLFLFNRSTGQALHEYMTHTMVVPATVDNEKTTLKNKFWRGHIFINSALMVVALWAVQFVQTRLAPSLLVAPTTVIKRLNHVADAQVSTAKADPARVEVAVKLDQPLNMPELSHLFSQIMFVVRHGTQGKSVQVTMSNTHHYGLIHWNNSLSVMQTL